MATTCLTAVRQAGMIPGAIPLTITLCPVLYHEVVKHWPNKLPRRKQRGIRIGTAADLHTAFGIRNLVS
ncbi:MAG: hypothetical protein DRH12_09795 [Deltaproteobacteria bacterium]|nr:MAG: hypothetical protein DRH12_09795 [Deltaproteobacteria bacterium]